MEGCVEKYLSKRGWKVNKDALSVVNTCDGWYANRVMPDFHKRYTVQNVPYELLRLNMAKRACSDDANLCELLEINAGGKDQDTFVDGVLAASEFQTQYRKQLEKTAADGTVACYIRLDEPQIAESGEVSGGRIRLNYVEAECFVPLTVENDIVTEVAFSGSKMEKGEKTTTLVIFQKGETGSYVAESVFFDARGNEIADRTVMLQLGEIKPFAVMQNAEVNNLDNMTGYGLPKLYNAIPMLKVLDLCFNVLFGDLDKADKLILVNEMLCAFDETGEPIAPNEQMKKTFVMMGKRLPEQKELYQEYNPEVRVDQITKAFELALSLLSMMFGYGTKRYSFENGQIKTATEYAGERQDMLQALNRQRQEATRYIRDIVAAVLWFSNTFQGTSWDLGAEVCVEFDDSYVTNREAELEQMRSDAISFADIPIFKVRYIMERLNCDEKQARAYLAEGQMDPDAGDEPED